MTCDHRRSLFYFGPGRKVIWRLATSLASLAGGAPPYNITNLIKCTDLVNMKIFEGSWFMWSHKPK